MVLWFPRRGECATVQGFLALSAVAALRFVACSAIPALVLGACSMDEKPAAKKVARAEGDREAKNEKDDALATDQGEELQSMPSGDAVVRNPPSEALPATTGSAKSGALLVDGDGRPPAVIEPPPVPVPPSSNEPPAESDTLPEAAVTALPDLIAGVATVVATVPGKAGIEGPVWHPSGYLLFSLVDNSEIWKWQPGSSPTAWRAIGRRSNGLTFDAQGDLVICEDSQTVVSRIASARSGAVAGTRTTLAGQFDGKAFHGPNDCVVDSAGNLYFTDPWYGAGRGGSSALGSSYGVYRATPTGALSLISNSFTPSVQEPAAFGWETAPKASPNGLALSPDESLLYVAVTGTNRVVKFSRQEDGTYGGRSVFTTEVSMPDGLKVDRAGRVYVATAQGIAVFRPDGSKLGVVKLPKQGGGDAGATNVAFGGPEMKSLFATADGNKIYRVELKVKGANPWPFSSTLPDTLSQ